MKRGILLFITIICIANFTKAQGDLVTAKNLTLSERFEDATIMYKSLLQKEPNNGDIYFYYGANILDEYISDPFSNSKSNVVKEANSIFQDGLKKDSLNPLNNIGLGMTILFDSGDTLKADKFLKKAEATLPGKIKKYTPDNLETALNLAKAELYAKNPRIKKALAYAKNCQTFTNDLDPNVFITMGDIYIAANKPSEAISNYNRALYLDEKNVLLLVNIGNIYIRARNINESKSYFEQAKEIDSTFAPLYKGLGEVYTMAGLYKYSKINYKKFLELSGNNVPAKVMYINSLFRSKDYAETLIQIEELQKIDNSRNYLNRLAAYSAFDKKPSDPEKALTYIETFFKNTTPDKIIPKDYVYHGRILVKLGQEDEQKMSKGLEILKKAYDDDNTNTEIMNELASSAYYSKRFPLAIEMYSIKVNSADAVTDDYMFLGKTYYQAGNYIKSDSVFSLLSKKEPDYLQAYVWIGNSRVKMDPDFKEGLAFSNYEFLIQKGLTDVNKYKKEIMEGYSYMSSFYLFSPKPDLNKAEEYANKMINLDPANKSWQVKGYKTLALISTKRKDYSQAVTFYKKVMTIDPSDADAKNAIEVLNKAIAAQKEAQ